MQTLDGLGHALKHSKIEFVACFQLTTLTSLFFLNDLGAVGRRRAGSCPPQGRTLPGPTISSAARTAIRSGLVAAGWEPEVPRVDDVSGVMNPEMIMNIQ